MSDLPDTTVSAVNNVVSLTGEPVNKPDIFKASFKAEKPDTKVKAFFETLWQIRAARKIKDPRLKLANRITRKCPPLAAGLSNLAQVYCTHLIEKIVAQARAVNYEQHQACEASVSSLLHGKHLQVFLKGKVIDTDNVLFGTLTARAPSLAGLIESIGQHRLIPAILKDFYHVNECYEHLYCQLHTMTAEERSDLKTTLPKLERWRRDRLWAKLYATCTRENRQDFEFDIVTQLTRRPNNLFSFAPLRQV